MAIKKIVCTSLLALSLSSVAVLAHAKLTVVNNTKQDSTAIINDGKCSSSLPFGKGVTKAGTTNELDDIVIGLACWGHASDCKADVYMTADCTVGGAKKVATVIFDTKKGIQSITNVSGSGYQITGGGFLIQADGGPALATKN